MDPIAAWLASRIRTAWPMVLGVLAARVLVIGAPLGAWLERTFGVHVTEAQVAAALGVVLGYLIYELGRALERAGGDSRAAQIARGVGRFVLSLGLPTGTPVYVQRDETATAFHERGGAMRKLR